MWPACWKWRWQREARHECSHGCTDHPPLAARRTGRAAAAAHHRGRTDARREGAGEGTVRAVQRVSHADARGAQGSGQCRARDADAQPRRVGHSCHGRRSAGSFSGYGRSGGAFRRVGLREDHRRRTGQGARPARGDGGPLQGAAPAGIFQDQRGHPHRHPQRRPQRHAELAAPDAVGPGAPRALPCQYDARTLGQGGGRA